jgi:hypothetical protein
MRIKTFKIFEFVLRKKRLFLLLAFFLAASLFFNFYMKINRVRCVEKEIVALKGRLGSEGLLVRDKLKKDGKIKFIFDDLALKEEEQKTIKRFLLVSDDAELRDRLMFLQNGNKVAFKRNAEIKISNSVVEIEEALINPVEVDEKDAEKIVKILESSKRYAIKEISIEEKMGRLFLSKLILIKRDFLDE